MTDSRRTIVGARDATLRDDKLTLEDCHNCTITGDRVTLIKCENCSVTGDMCKLIRCTECTVDGDGCSMEDSSMCVGSGDVTSVAPRRGVTVKIQLSQGCVTNAFGSGAFKAIIGGGKPASRVVPPPRTIGRADFGGGSTTNIEGNNVWTTNKSGVFINDIQVPEGTVMSQKKIFFKCEQVTDEKLFEEYPSLRMALESIK